MKKIFMIFLLVVSVSMERIVNASGFSVDSFAENAHKAITDGIRIIQGKPTLAEEALIKLRSTCRYQALKSIVVGYVMLEAGMRTYSYCEKSNTSNKMFLSGNCGLAFGVATYLLYDKLFDSLKYLFDNGGVPILIGIGSYQAVLYGLKVLKDYDSKLAQELIDQQNQIEKHSFLMRKIEAALQGNQILQNQVKLEFNSRPVSRDAQDWASLCSRVQNLLQGHKNLQRIVEDISNGNQQGEEGPA